MCLHPLGLASDHRPSVQSVPFGLFYPESKKLRTCHGLGRSREGSWCLPNGLVVDFSEHMDELSLTLFWDEETGLVTRLMSSGLWEELSCSLLPPGSPSDSFIRLLWSMFLKFPLWGNFLSGTQSTCLKPCLWSPGPWTQLHPSLEGCGPCGVRLRLNPWGSVFKM